MAIVVAAIVFASAIGPRPDIAAAAGTMRFLFKFVVTALLAVTAVSALSALSRPQAASRRRIMLLAAAPLALLAAVALELAVMPSAQWGTRLVGSNSLYCLSRGRRACCGRHRRHALCGPLYRRFAALRRHLVHAGNRDPDRAGRSCRPGLRTLVSPWLTLCRIGHKQHISEIARVLPLRACAARL